MRRKNGRNIIRIIIIAPDHIHREMITMLLLLLIDQNQKMKFFFQLQQICGFSLSKNRISKSYFIFFLVVVVVHINHNFSYLNNNHFFKKKIIRPNNIFRITFVQIYLFTFNLLLHLLFVCFFSLFSSYFRTSANNIHHHHNFGT